MTPAWIAILDFRSFFHSFQSSTRIEGPLWVLRPSLRRKKQRAFSPITFSDIAGLI
jgi:hypothetical protein